MVLRRLSGTAVVLGVLVIGLLATAPTGQATTGSVSLDPGQTVYVGYGNCGKDWLLLWSLSISTWSTVFSDWLEKPDGTRLSLSSTTWGVITDMPGEWRLGFSIDPSGLWGATVTYDIRVVVPSLAVLSPVSGAYSRTPTTTISGTFDGYASEVEVSRDNVHFEQADTESTAWIATLQLAEGTNTIYARALYYWGSYSAVYTVDPITVTLDTESPTVGITNPLEGIDVRGGYVDITWQCSDNCNIALVEMKIDGWDWHAVSGYEAKDVWLPSGYHVIQIRVTDNAGNQAIDSTFFNNDNRALSFGGPYYGLPTVAIIIAVIAGAVAIVMTFLKRKGGPTVATVPKEEPAPEAPPTPP